MRVAKEPILLISTRDVQNNITSGTWHLRGAYYFMKYRVGEKLIDPKVQKLVKFLSNIQRANYSNPVDFGYPPDPRRVDDACNSELNTIMNAPLLTRKAKRIISLHEDHELTFHQLFPTRPSTKKEQEEYDRKTRMIHQIGNVEVFNTGEAIIHVGKNFVQFDFMSCLR